MRAGIVGIGKLGSIHLRICREIPDISKIFIADNDPDRLAAHPDIPGATDYRQLLGKVDMVTIASPLSLITRSPVFFWKTAYRC